MGNKTLLITIKPQHLCNILNGIKTIEVRKNKNLANAVKKLIGKYDGNCRIKCVCSKSDLWLIHDKRCNYYYTLKKSKSAVMDIEDIILNGKVACEIVVDKVGGITYGQNGLFQDIFISDVTDNLCKDSCLTYNEIDKYLENKSFFHKDGYALHIKTVIPYEKPKELKEFYKVGYHNALNESWQEIETSRFFSKELIENIRSDYRLIKAPQNFCYVEEE